MLFLLHIFSIYFAISSANQHGKNALTSYMRDKDVSGVHGLREFLPRPEPELSLNISSYLMYLLASSELYGKWINLNKNQHKPIFLANEGFSHLTHHVKNSIVKLCNYNSASRNSQGLCFNFVNFSFAESNSSLDNLPMEFQGEKLYIREVKDAEPDFRGTDFDFDIFSLTLKACASNYSIHFVSITNNKPFEPSYDPEIDKDNLAIMLNIESSECSLNLTSRLLFPKYNLSLNNILDYLGNIVLFGFTVQLFGFGWVSENYITYQKKVVFFTGISLGKLLIIQFFDFYLAFQHWIGYLVTLSNSNVRPAKFIPAPSIMMVIAFMSSMIHGVRQQQKHINLPGYSTVRRLNCTVWLIVPLLALTASLAWQEHRAILLIGCLYEVPQIIQNYLTQTKHSWNFFTAIFLVFPKIGYMGWTLFFADVILGYNCDLEFYIFCLLLVLQITALIIQTQRPKLWAKVKSLYKSKSIAELEDVQEICSICLEVSLQITDEKSCWPLRKWSNDGEMILTPCNHQFHRRCLNIWFKKNITCPYCRSHLPPM